MLGFLLRRVLWMIPTTLGIVLVVFALFHAVPGDPAVVALGSEPVMDGADHEARLAAFRREHGLDRSILVQVLCVIGPFNLLRDGHPWFRSPCPEREVERVPLADGTIAVEGVPLELEPIAGTSDEERAAIRAALEAIAGDDAARRDAAAPELAARGEKAWPPALNALRAAALGGEAARAERIALALERASGARGAAPERIAAIGALAHARHWYGWHYTHGGDTVRNRGARPWGGLLALDLGRERLTRASVARELARRLAVTVPLALAAAILSYAIAIPLGVLSARRRGGRADGAIAIGLYALYSVPTFWGGLLLVMLFGASGPDLAWWPRLPVLGLHGKDAATLGPWAYAWDAVLHSILPVITLAYASLAYLARQMRASMSDVLGEEFVRALRARGLSERSIVYRHALRNALLPIVTLFGSVLPMLIGGSVIVETVFDLPGMGKYAYEGLLQRDLSVVMATTLLMGIMTQIGLLLSDVLYGVVDPRVRHA